MRFSIETRLPYLDFNLVESELNKSIENKSSILLKSSLRNLLKNYTATSIPDRRDKIGFAAPTDIWITDNEEEMIRSIQGSDLLSKYFNLKRKINYSCNKGLFWRLFIVSRWERICLKK